MIRQDWQGKARIMLQGWMLYGVFKLYTVFTFNVLFKKWAYNSVGFFQRSIIMKIINNNGIEVANNIHNSCQALKIENIWQVWSKLGLPVNNHRSLRTGEVRSTFPLMAP